MCSLFVKFYDFNTRPTKNKVREPRLLEGL